VTGGDSRPESRHAELAAALVAVRERVAAASVSAGRDPSEVTLLPVTKTRPASDVALLLDLGCDAFGENRPQEAAAKASDVADLRPGCVARWHLVGRLQRNKARSVVAWAARVESVDSERLVDALGAEVVRARELDLRRGPLPVLLQISLDGDPDRAGVPVAEASARADRIVESAGLELHGVMAVAPLGDDPDRAFGVLAEIAARIRADHPGAVVLSAGMSGDLEAAIRNGSTCVRVGTALLGDRRLTSR
jgi:hypothetical protein